MSNEQNTQNKGPVDRINEGGVYAKLWEQNGDKGRFISIETGRTYKDQNGKYKTSHSFTRAGLMKLESVIRRANEEARKWEEYYRIKDQEQQQAQIEPAQPQSAPQGDLMAERDAALANTAPETSTSALEPDHGPTQ